MATSDINVQMEEIIKSGTQMVGVRNVDWSMHGLANLAGGHAPTHCKPHAGVLPSPCHCLGDARWTQS